MFKEQSMFTELYTTRGYEREPFGAAWCGPAVFEHGKETLVARYESGEDEDGQGVEIYCCALPARLYTIRALAGKNSAGEPLGAYEIGTGSSMAELSAQTGKAIASGMLVLRQKGENHDA